MKLSRMPKVSVDHLMFCPKCKSVFYGLRECGFCE